MKHECILYSQIYLMSKTNFKNDSSNITVGAETILRYADEPIFLAESKIRSYDNKNVKKINVKYILIQK